MNLGVIIQARMGSTRLPGKIFKCIGSKTLLEHIIYRAFLLRHDHTFVIATSNLSADDIVAKFCNDKKINCFRGSESDVLERYYQCAKLYCFDHIVRLTADNPFVDMEEVDRLIDLHIESNSDYTHSFNSLPVGVGSEIFTFAALEKSFREGHEPHHREHVNEYMLENPKIFKTVKLQVNEMKQRPDIRLTVDTIDDYNKACYIINNSLQDIIPTEEAIKLCLQYA